MLLKKSSPRSKLEESKIADRENAIQNSAPQVSVAT